MNNRYTIRIENPMLRPGLSIQTDVSKRYVEPATRELLELVRSINTKDIPDDFKVGGTD